MKAWSNWLVFSGLASCVFAVWYKKTMVEKRKQGYIDFYKTYDEAKEFEAMKKAGIFKGFEWTD